MKAALRVLGAETLKQHRRMFGSKLVVFSMLIWPLLQLLVTFYNVRPVVNTPGVMERWPIAADPERLLAFLATGALGYTFFFALVQSAWHFSFERRSGTLELLFLAPVNRLVLVISNSVGAVVQSTWLFTFFCAALASLFDVARPANPAIYLVVYASMLVPAVAWGAFLNSLLMFSRDSAFLYVLLDDPLWFVSGVRLPVFVLPTWIKAIGFMIPLTGSLVVVRGALLESQGLVALLPEISLLVGLSALFLVFAAILLRLGEARAQKTGQLRLI